MMRFLRFSVLPKLRRLHFPVLLLLSVMPVFLAWLSINAPDTLPAAYLLFAVYTLLSGVCVSLPGKIRMPAAIVSCMVLLTLTFGLLSIRAYPLILLLPAGLGALLLYALPLAAR